jgi:hypothetical protein
VHRVIVDWGLRLRALPLHQGLRTLTLPKRTSGEFAIRTGVGLKDVPTKASVKMVAGVMQTRSGHLPLAFILGPLAHDAHTRALPSVPVSLLNTWRWLLGIGGGWPGRVSFALIPATTRTKDTFCRGVPVRPA